MCFADIRSGICSKLPKECLFLSISGTHVRSDEQITCFPQYNGTHVRTEFLPDTRTAIPAKLAFHMSFADIIRQKRVLPGDTLSHPASVKALNMPERFK
jgi:hypothetical protein